MLVADVQDRIRELVLAKIGTRELSQYSLAKLLNLQQPHISNFVTGKRGLSIEVMDGILKVLQLEVDDLLPSGQFSNSTEKSESQGVPLIALQSTMRSVIAASQILGLVSFRKTFLRRLRRDSPDDRESWMRFVAVKTDSDSSDPMYPRLGQGAVSLIDRHYCSLRPYRKNVPNLYLIRKGDEYLIRRVEVQGTVICLRPENGNHPIDVISINSRDNLTSCIVGRVAHIAAEV